MAITIELAGGTRGVSVENDAVEVEARTFAIDFGMGLSVTDNGDKTVTVDANATGASVSNGGTEIVAVPTDLNFGAGVTASDDGDGTVTIVAGGTDPAGADTQIQFNDAGGFGADPNFTYDGETMRVKAQSGQTAPILRLDDESGSSVMQVSPGATAAAVLDNNAFQLTDSNDPAFTSINPGGSALNLVSGLGGSVFQVSDANNFQIGFNTRANIEVSQLSGFDSKIFVTPDRTSFSTDVLIDQNTDASSLLVRYDGANRFFVQDSRTGVLGELQVEAQTGQVGSLLSLIDDTSAVVFQLDVDGTVRPDGSTAAVSGSFTAQSGETITVTNGIITSIV